MKRQLLTGVIGILTATALVGAVHLVRSTAHGRRRAWRSLSGRPGWRRGRMGPEGKFARRRTMLA